MTLAAAQTAGDYELRQGGIANSGTVEAVAPLSVARGQYVVVTRESTTAIEHDRLPGPPAGVAPRARDRARAAHRQWVLSGWQPEN